MGDLHRVQDALRQQVTVLAGRGIVAVAVGQVGDAGDHDGTVEAGVVGDPVGRTAQCACQGLDAHGLIAVEALGEDVELLGDLDQDGTATGDHAFLGGRAGGVDGVLDAQLALVDLGLGGTTGTDDGDTSGQLGQTLLELLPVPGGVGALDVVADLDAAGLQVLDGTGTVDDDGLVLGDGDAAGGTEGVQGDLGEVAPELLVHHGATGDDGEVVHEGLAAVAEVRGLHRDGLDGLADGVDDEHLQRLAVDVLSHDEQFLAGLGDLLQDGQEVGQGADLLAHQQDGRVLQDGLGGLLLGDEVGRQVALVEGDSLGDDEFVGQRLGLLDGEDAVLTDGVHGLGDLGTDALVTRGHGGDASDGGTVGDRDGTLGEQLQGLVGSGGDAVVDGDRVRAGGDGTHALVDQGLGQQGGGGGPVTGDVVGLHGDGLHQLGTEVLEGVLEIDVAGDGHTVVGDDRATEGLVEDDVAALGPQGDAHRVSQRVHTALETLTGLLVECDEF